MANYFTVYFSSSGVPATGLSPTWTSLKEVDGTNYTQPTILEIGGGWYKYILSASQFEHIVGVIDGGASLANADRYKSVEIRYSDLSQKEHKEFVVLPVYDEDTLALTFFAFLNVNGELITTGLSSISLTVYNEDHEEEFSLTTSSFTNGVAVLSQNSPTLTKNKGYYVIASVTTTFGTFSSAETYIALE
jgi:hypothetical protein